MDIIFAGTPEFAVASLKSLIYSNHNVQAVLTQPDRPKGRGKKLSSSPIKKIAIEHDIPLHQPLTLTSQEARDIFSKYSPDLIVVVAYGLILPKYVLEYPKISCINVHASILPALRGAAPIQYAILTGLKTTGITIMKMEEGLDSGDILQQQELNIRDNDTTLTISNRLAKLGGSLLIDIINNYFSIKPIAQDDQKATYAPKIKKSMARINWRESAERINRVVRALNPNPVAYTEFNDLRIKLYETEIIKETETEIGVIQNLSPRGLDISTGNGVIRVKHCQFPGKNVIDANNIYNAYRDFFAVGKSFSL